MMSKTNIKGMTQEELISWCQKMGESKYSGIQLYEWMYKHGIKSFNEISNINKEFKDYLNKNCILNTLTLNNLESSKIDNTTKFLFKTIDNKFIETVSMIDGRRRTICISSQVGCALKCSFCETGKIGLKRNLSVGEIVDQLIFTRDYQSKLITNIVFMGMGEPFQNYNNVINAADIFHSERGFNLASRRITISTAGVLPKIKQFIKEKKKYKLAISLNASEDMIRDEIMPINKKWSISELISEGKKYSNMKKREIMFEYVLLKGINDSTKDAYLLANLLKGVSCKLNIIPYNETCDIYKRSTNKSIEEFSDILFKYRNGYKVFIRWSKGQDINAGCGQLAGKN